MNIPFLKHGALVNLTGSKISGKSLTDTFFGVVSVGFNCLVDVVLAGFNRLNDLFLCFGENLIGEITIVFLMVLIVDLSDFDDATVDDLIIGLTGISDVTAMVTSDETTV